MTSTNKKIKDMTKEERAAYQREWYAKKVSNKSSHDLIVHIHNCPDDLKNAFLSALNCFQTSGAHNVK